MYFRVIYFFVKCAFVIFFRYSTRSFLGICDRFWLVSFQFNYILCTGHFLSIIIRIEPHCFQRRWISGANFTPLIPFGLLGDKRLLSLQCIIGLLFHINIDINYWCGIFIVQDTQNKRNKGLTGLLYTWLLPPRGIFVLLLLQKVPSNLEFGQT